MCGLAGIISTEKKEKFNVNHFNLLGTLNDERGGDSCGIFIDGEVKYGINEEAMFRNFMYDVKYPEVASIALLHCRKASPGYPVNLHQAQPVIIKNRGNIDFVMMHNGTITNIQELAKKYLPKVDTYTLSDSQILARIIYKCGYEVLKEYTGCAVLIIVDYRFEKPRVLMFKGSSCYNEASSKSERPLYHMYNGGKFYFSSMFNSLYCINNKKIIYDFPVNTLCEVTNNKLYTVEEIDRTHLKKPAYSSNYASDYTRLGYIKDNIECDKSTGLYMLNGAVAHGKYRAYPSGYIVNGIHEAYAVNSYEFSFFRGRLLLNEKCFDFLKSIDDLFEDDVLSVMCPEVIDYFSYGPRLLNKVSNVVNENFEYTPLNDGSYSILFRNSDLVEIKNGIRSPRYITALEAIDKFKECSDNVFFNFEELEQQIMEFISVRLTDVDAVQ